MRHDKDDSDESDPRQSSRVEHAMSRLLVFLLKAKSCSEKKTFAAKAVRFSDSCLFEETMRL